MKTKITAIICFTLWIVCGYLSIGVGNFHDLKIRQRDDVLYPNLISRYNNQKVEIYTNIGIRSHKFLSFLGPIVLFAECANSFTQVGKIGYLSSDDPDNYAWGLHPNNKELFIMDFKK